MFVPKNTEINVNAAQTRAQDALAKIEIHERRIEKLKLYNAALTVIIMKKLGVTEAEINDLVNDLDLLDGKVDGTLAMKTAKCAHCGKVLNNRLDSCMYCGVLDTSRPFIETI